MASLRIPRGTVKPPLGARVNPDHPFARGHLLSLLCNEGMAPYVNYTNGPNACFGSAPRRAVFGQTYLGSGTPVAGWRSNREGLAYRFEDIFAEVFCGADFVPATAVTILVIRRKTDTTNRASSLFGVGTSGAGTLTQAHVPYSDGTVYWDFGTFTGANRLTATGLSFSTTIPERWIFTAGPRGSSIWQNGRKVASQTTALTRTVATVDFHINQHPAGSITGDLQDLNFFSAIGEQWSDDLCRWWSAEPYAHLYTPLLPTARVFLSEGAAGAPSPITGTATITIGPPVLAGAGVSTPPAITGTGTITIAAPTLAGTGTATPPAITGTGALAIGAPGLAGAGTVIHPPGWSLLVGGVLQRPLDGTLRVRLTANGRHTLSCALPSLDGTYRPALDAPIALFHGDEEIG